MKKTIFLILSILISSYTINSQTSEKKILENLDQKSEEYSAIAQEIWGLAEMGYQEQQSSALLQKTLSDAGFTVNKGVAGIPTAFIAEYGSGTPIIAIMGEYDALPGLSQEAVAEKKSAGKAAGHACGHHLFGTASTAAAIATKDWLKATNKLPNFLLARTLCTLTVTALPLRGLRLTIWPPPTTPLLCRVRSLPC